MVPLRVRNSEVRALHEPPPSGRSRRKEAHFFCRAPGEDRPSSEHEEENEEEDEWCMAQVCVRSWGCKLPINRSPQVGADARRLTSLAAHPEKIARLPRTRRRTRRRTIGSWPQCAFRSWRCKLSMNLPPSGRSRRQEAHFFCRAPEKTARLPRTRRRTIG